MQVTLPFSYVQAIDGATALIERLVPPPYVSSGDIWGLAAGPDGFVAIGYAAARSDRSAQSFSVFSADGAAWQMTDLPMNISAVAWGPAGWLAVGSVDDPASPAIWVFRSADGLHWSSMGVAPGLTYASQLVGSESGYLMESSGGFSESSLWFSGDGVTWVETAPAEAGGDFGWRVAGIGSGFYAWSDEAQPAGLAQQAFSADGRTWSTVEGGPTRLNLKITTLGDRIIAAVTADDGSLRFRTGEIGGSRFAWEPAVLPGTDVAGEAFYPGVGVSALVSDGRLGLAVAILWVRATDEPVVWTSVDGLQWRPRPLPTGAFGGIPRLAVGGPAGLVVVGSRPTLRGPNPIFWREVGPGAWEPEPAPLFDVVPDPSGDECGAPPRDFLDFTVLDRPLAVACFGDAPFTFRAWSTSCDGCYYEGSDQYDPAWLANPTTNLLLLSPIPTDYWGGQQVITSPTLAIDPAWTGQWIEVTGHFDDPAAASCHWTPTPTDDAYYIGQRWVVDNCRQQFVVTAVTVVDGP